MQNLTSLHVRGNISLLDCEKFMFYICQNLQKLQVLILHGLKLTDKSFSEICMLCSLTKLSIGSIPLFACSIFHHIKSHSTLRELGFDGLSFLELSIGEELTEERKQEIYNDIRVLNKVPKLS